MSDREEALGQLDDLFASARQARPRMSADLTAAILQDAAIVRRDGDSAVPNVAVPRSEAMLHRLWRQFSTAIGGWPALGGLAAASVAGLWIGLAPPSFLPDPAERYVALSSGSQLVSNAGYDVILLMGEEVLP